MSETIDVDLPTPAQHPASHAGEVARGERFEFGRNWSRFLSRLDDARILEAERSLRAMLGVETLAGKRFLDIGSGSGLFSLAARRLGARVHSFDYDPYSVACTRELRRRFFPDDSDWRVEEGSALDSDYLRGLGTFDVVYSWGVLHHTGSMWLGLELAAQRVAPGGLLFIAIYNDRGPESDRWRAIKRTYCRIPRWARAPFALLAMLPYEARDLARSLVELRPGAYLRSWTHYRGNRGMSRWHDIVDWVGGYPYEVAGADELVRFYQRRGFTPRTVAPTNGLGCNEIVLQRHA